MERELEMPATFKIRPRMRTLLSPAVTKVELVGVVAWLGVLLVDPVPSINWLNFSITMCLLLVCHFHRATGNFLVWRLLGGVYIVVLAFGFSCVIDSGAELRVFALPLAVIIVVSSAILFITVQDYLLSSALVWILMWSNLDVGMYRGLEVYLVLFCVSSMSIGFTLSFTYLKNMRSVLLIESEFRTLAETDFLTSILNRRAFMESFQQVMAGGGDGYFIMLDIDSFKIKNDQYGHDVGD